MNTKLNWYLVVNADKTILAVYGSALLGEAQAKGTELSKLGLVGLHRVETTKRPRVGGKLPARSHLMPLSF